MKYIYLDQKIWIALAKDIVKGNPEKKDLLNKIDEKISSNEWAFPLSLIHQMETSKRLDDRTRKELSNVMGKYSKNCTIAPYLLYKAEEFIVSLLSLHGIIKDQLILKNKIIKSDFANLLGLDFNDIEITSDEIPKEIRGQLKNDFLEYIKNKDLFSFYTEHYSSKAFATEMTEDLAYYAQCYEEARKQLFESVPEKHKEYRYRIFLIRCFTEMFREELQTIQSFATKAKINVNKIFPSEIFSTKDSTMHFLCGAPSFHVNTALTFELLNNKDRKLSGNDYLDISFLSAAIPYCDVVITERSWASIAKKYKLDSTYDTQVFNNIDDLMCL